MVLHGERQPRGDIAEPAPVWGGPAPGPVTTALTWRLRYRRFGPKRRPFRGVEQGRFSRLTAIGQNPVGAKSLHSDGGRPRLLNGRDRSVPAPIMKTAATPGTHRHLHTRWLNFRFLAARVVPGQRGRDNVRFLATMGRRPTP